MPMIKSALNTKSAVVQTSMAAGRKLKNRSGFPKVSSFVECVRAAENSSRSTTKIRIIRAAIEIKIDVPKKNSGIVFPVSQ